MVSLWLLSSDEESNIMRRCASSGTKIDRSATVQKEWGPFRAPKERAGWPPLAMTLVTAKETKVGAPRSLVC